MFDGNFMRRMHVIAHRGASAYAPENTLAAFELAVRQGAGCLEHDLQVTRDGVLVCLHDRTLDRTTNVREALPDRGRTMVAGAPPHWFVHDFTLAEIRSLDAGGWFGAEFRHTRVATFDDLLEWSRHRVAVLTELKDVEAYEAIGVDVLARCATTLGRHGVTTRSGGPAVTVQSFHEGTIRRASSVLPGSVPVALLVDEADKARLADRERIASIAAFASGIGPAKALIAAQPDIVDLAHAVGMRVTPWTFRAGATAPFDSVAAETHHHLDALGVDAVITDHPDLVQP
jgi:glycerophosphoryl diester phosphodiesterase